MFFFLGQSLEVLAQSEPLSEDTDAKQLYQPSLEYPQNALDAGQEGACIVNFYVSSFGKPQSVSATCSDPVFTNEAIAMVNGSMYSPRMMNGHAVLSSKIVLPVNFSLENHELAQSQKADTPVPPQEDKLAASGIEQKVNNLSFKIDGMECAEQAQNESKPDKFMGQIGALAKVVGYDDVAKGLAYYQSADNVIKQLSKEEKSLFEVCMRKRGHGGLSAPVISEVAPSFQTSTKVASITSKAVSPEGFKRITIIRDKQFISGTKIFVVVDGERVARAKREEELIIEVPNDAKFIRAKFDIIKQKKFALDNVRDGDVLRLKYNRLALRPNHTYVFEHKE